MDPCHSFDPESQRSCSHCALQDLCLPAGVDEQGLALFDHSLEKHWLDSGQILFRNETPFNAIYVVRAGSLRTCLQSADGDLQVLGFHLPGEWVGLDAISSGKHTCEAQALERTGYCELPYAKLQSLAAETPSVQHQLMRVISREILNDHQHLVLMGKPLAQQRVAIFLKSLSQRYQRLQRDSKVLTLSMSRSDIASYLGLVIETVSRALTRMEKMGVLTVKRRSIEILQPEQLDALCATTEPVPHGNRRHAH